VGGREGKIRLDFNENTVGCSPRVCEFLQRALSGGLLATYPEYSRSRNALARFFGVEANCLTITNGTDEAIQILANTYVDSGDEAIILTPTYAMYRFYLEVQGAEIVEVPYKEKFNDFVFPVEELLSAVGPQTKSIFIANPNNPTGSDASIRSIELVLNAAPQACVLVDEAYFEFHGESALPLVEEYENLFVCRTFSKAYGMAGLRVGVLLSQQQNIAAVRKVQSPYSVNMVAALAVTEAIKDRAYVENYVAQAKAGKQAIETGLTDLGYRFWRSTANFTLFDAGAKADAILSACRDSGVLVRDRRHDVPNALRVTAGTPEQAAQFIKALEALK
jgi:histidinol-phosphate aminotransferase